MLMSEVVVRWGIVPIRNSIQTIKTSGHIGHPTRNEYINDDNTMHMYTMNMSSVGAIGTELHCQSARHTYTRTSNKLLEFRPLPGSKTTYHGSITKVLGTVATRLSEWYMAPLQRLASAGTHRWNAQDRASSSFATGCWQRRMSGQMRKDSCAHDVYLQEAQGWQIRIGQQYQCFQTSPSSQPTGSTSHPQRHKAFTYAQDRLSQYESHSLHAWAENRSSQGGQQQQQPQQYQFPAWQHTLDHRHRS